MFTNWKDYEKTGQAGSWSQRITGSGHITVSAVLLLNGGLKAFPPRAANDAFPVFCVLNATAGGKISETLSGVYPSKGWELPASVHHARAKLWKVFIDLYQGVREQQVAAVERDSAREALMGSFNFSEIVVDDKEKLNGNGIYAKFYSRISFETAIILEASGVSIADPDNSQNLVWFVSNQTWYLIKYQTYYFLMSSISEDDEENNIKKVEINYTSLSAEEAGKIVELWK